MRCITMLLCDPFTFALSFSLLEIKQWPSFTFVKGNARLQWQGERHLRSTIGKSCYSDLNLTAQEIAAMSI